MKQVIVIGGGIIGLCTAYFLQKEGHRVIVIEKGDFSKGASYVNAGFLSPSHFIPLAAPGILSTGLKMMINKNSPFYIKPRFEKEFLQWTWAFKKSANQITVDKAIPVYKELILKSTQLYKELKNEKAIDFHLENKGLLVLYKTSKYEDKENKIAQRALKEGLQVAFLQKNEVKKLEPTVSENLVGGIHYKNDAHTTPPEFMKKIKTYLLKNGVRFQTNQKVISFLFKNKRVAGVMTQNKTYNADEIVIASGSWTPLLLKKLGVKLLLQAGKGYKIDIHKNTGVQYPALLAEAKVAITPMQHFTRLAGTMELSGINHKILKNRVTAITNLAQTYYTNLGVKANHLKHAQCGLRPVSPDGLPYIGKLTKYTNVTIATGHAMMGWTLGPITGKLVSQLIANEKPLVSLELFHPERKF